MSALVIGSEK